MRNTALVLVVIFLLGGCASHTATTTSFEYTRVYSQSQLVTMPPLNSESEAEIGQSMVQAARKAVTPAITLTEGIFHPKGSTWVVRSADMEVTIQPSLLRLIGTDQDGSYYQAAPKEAAISFLVSVGGYAGVYVPNNKSAIMQVYWNRNDNEGYKYPHPGIKYETTTVEEWGTDSFKRELVYQGVSQNTVSIRYREFNDDMARPAFTEDLKYDLSQGDVIGYKGARFQIIKANNLSIRYKVLKPLD
jgi:hypothetical protein